MSEEAQTVQDGIVVLMHYTLRDDNGKILDSSRGKEVMPYLHGYQNIVPGLEAELSGCKVGDQKKVTVPPEGAYGERTPPEPQAVPRKEFGKNAELHPGMRLTATGSDGQRIPLWIAKVEGAKVWVDHNHPLAGQTLHFDIEIMGMRAPTADELSHGHPHGPDGTSHHH